MQRTKPALTWCSFT